MGSALQAYRNDFGTRSENKNCVILSCKWISILYIFLFFDFFFDLIEQINRFYRCKVINVGGGEPFNLLFTIYYLLFGQTRVVIQSC